VTDELNIGLEPEEIMPLQTKAQISSSYIEDCKRLFPATENTPGSALIVGARPGNIGWAIQENLMLEGWRARSFSSETWDRAEISRGDGALILANGTNHLDWVEGFSTVNAMKVINDSFTESVLTAQNFVRRTLGTPYRKKIVFIGSMAYRNVLNGSSVYCAAKAAIAQYSRCLAWELAPKGYDVFCVHPANTLDTPMTEETIKA
jgi:hypothetical protein